MSHEDLQRLLVLLEADPILRRRLEEAAAEGEGPLLSAFETAGARVGAAPSREDVGTLLASASALGSGELNEPALDRVAGGVTVGDDVQLANVDLQNMLQKQQQTLQTMSNISKMVHDTAMNTIRKIGG
jgi:hypothetical protein